MKAISCPQCGSLIRDILPRQPIAECEYCGAKVIVNEHFPTPEPFDEEAAKFRALAALPAEPRSPMQPIFIAIAGIGAFFLIMFVVSLLPAKPNYVAPNSPEPDTPIVFPTISPNLQKTLDDAILEVGDKEKKLENIQKQQNKTINKKRR